MGLADSTIRLWHTQRKGKGRYHSDSFYRGLQARVSALAFHPVQEGLLAYGTQNGRIGLYDVLQDVHLRELPGHRGAVYHLQWLLVNHPHCAADTETKGSVSGFLYSLGADGVLLETHPACDLSGPLLLRLGELEAPSDDSGPRAHKLTGFSWQSLARVGAEAVDTEAEELQIERGLLAVGCADGAVMVFAPCREEAANGSTGQLGEAPARGSVNKVVIHRTTNMVRL